MNILAREVVRQPDGRDHEAEDRFGSCPRPTETPGPRQLRRQHRQPDPAPRRPLGHRDRVGAHPQQRSRAPREHGLLRQGDRVVQAQEAQELLRVQDPHPARLRLRRPRRSGIHLHRGRIDLRALGAPALPRRHLPGALSPTRTRSPTPAEQVWGNFITHVLRIRNRNSFVYGNLLLHLSDRIFYNLHSCAK